MDASEFTRFLRSKALASGKYVSGIPRDSAELLVEKVAKALGVCCEGQTGYFYVLADLTIDNNPANIFTATFASSNPAVSYALVVDNQVTPIQSQSLTVTKTSIPPGSTSVSIVSNSPVPSIDVQGPAITAMGLQTPLSTASGATLALNLENPTGAVSTLQTGLACLLASSGISTGSVTISTLRASSRRTTITVTQPPPSQTINTCGV